MEYSLFAFFKWTLMAYIQMQPKLICSQKSCFCSTKWSSMWNFLLHTSGMHTEKQFQDHFVKPTHFPVKRFQFFTTPFSSPNNWRNCTRHWATRYIFSGHHWKLRVSCHRIKETRHNRKYRVKNLIVPSFDFHQSRKTRSAAIMNLYAKVYQRSWKWQISLQPHKYWVYRL